ncbi:hypothetical protein [Serratia marcescens]|uniref:hypothetical protein n=1 Tax=Serratia marcescens TaxID=615 RepID=UPI0029D99BAE|nr:hypothetical protein [Serratia marcescens]MDX7539606.1 hypothetical protein [Serratia marcescens]
MGFSKLFSTLTAISARTGEKYKYEIFQDLSDGSYFAVISAQQDFATEKYGTTSVWVQVVGYLRLTSTNVPTCEEECKIHFESI